MPLFGGLPLYYPSGGFLPPPVHFVPAWTHSWASIVQSAPRATTKLSQRQMYAWKCPKVRQESGGRLRSMGGG